MSDGPTADCPRIFHQTVPVIENIPLARTTFRIRLLAPELARAIRPGQFIMLRAPGQTDPLLGRPFALYDTVLASSRQPHSIDIVYLVVGKLTGWLSRLVAGDLIELWGPLGNGFPDLA